jgi:signal transduction histidine kinase
VRAIVRDATLDRMLKRNSRALPLHISLLIIGGVCLVIGNAVSLWANLRELKAATEWHSHTWVVVNRIDDVRTTLMDAEAGLRAFFATRNPDFLQAYARAKAALPGHVAELQRLVADNSRQVALGHKLLQLTDERMVGMEKRIAQFRNGDEALAIAQAFHIGGQQTAGIRQLLTTMTEEELALARVRAAGVYRTYVQTNRLATVMSVVVLLLLVLTYFLIDRNVRRREKAEQALQALNASLEETVLHRTAQLSQLSARLQNIAEHEKMALANELHDELGANLTAMNLDVAAVATRIKDTHPALAARLERALHVLLDTVQLKRRIIHGLRPSLLDTLGLGSAVTALCEDYSARTGRPCNAQVAEEWSDIDPEWTIALYRIAQECLTNITKHAQASEVHVVLSREAQGVRLRVVDDGIGIDHNVLDKSLSHGLRGMRERVRQLGGLFVIRRADERGTIAEAFLPFPGLAVSP